MNWSYQYDPTYQVITVQANGRITMDELKTGARTITSIPDFTSDIRVLLDFSRASEMALDAEGLIALARHPAFSAHSKRAVIAPRGLPWGAFQFYKNHATPGSVEVFSRRAEALQWLNDGVAPERQLPIPAGGSRPGFDVLPA